MPLATIDELRAELEDTNRSLLRLGEGIIISDQRRHERRSILLRWRDGLEAEIARRETNS